MPKTTQVTCTVYLPFHKNNQLKFSCNTHNQHLMEVNPFEKNKTVKHSNGKTIFLTFPKEKTARVDKPNS